MALVLWSASVVVARAQDLVPGAYSPAPVGINILTTGMTFSDGAVSFEPSLPIDDARAAVGGAGFGFNRTLNIGGRFASAGVGVPFLFGHVEGEVNNQFQQASRTGFADLNARFAINLYGAPAMTLRQFAAYRPTTVVGVSLVVGVPVGQYNSARYINLGTNRWSFKPEIGLSRTRGRWTFEGDFGAIVYTDNTNFVNESTREQAPIVALQGHLIYTVRPATGWRRMATTGRADGSRPTASLRPQNRKIRGWASRSRCRCAGNRSGSGTVLAPIRRLAATSTPSACRIPTPGPIAAPALPDPRVQLFFSAGSPPVLASAAGAGLAGAANHWSRGTIFALSGSAS